MPNFVDDRNRTFLSGGYDGSRLRLGTTLRGLAPTPAQIQQAEGLLATQNIPVNQLGLSVVGLYSNLGLSGPFVVDNRGQQSPNSMVAKMDHQISECDSLSGRMLYANGEDALRGGCPGPGGS